jgi:hypothetical protein
MFTKGLAKPTFEYLRSKIIGWKAHFSCFDLVSIQCLEYNFERECRYRFSGKPISSYMSLTLARLCGYWRLVSVNYKLVSGNYKAQGASGGKYEAQIVIFRILATVNRFSRISWKAENR